MLGLAAILPLFLMIGLGYLAKLTVLDVKFLPGLNQFVYYFAVPALLFDAASQQQLNDLVNGPAWFAISLAIVLSCATVALVFRFYFKVTDKAAHILQGLNAVFANFAYMGIPLSFEVLGKDAYAATISIVLLGNIIIISGSQLLLAMVQQGRFSVQALWQVLQYSLLKNPIFVSTVAGLTCAYTQLPLPDSIQQLLDLLAPAAIPVALFCLGASLQFKRTDSGYGQIFTLVSAKLLLHPALTLLCFYALGMEDSVWATTAVILCALPTGTLAHVVALQQQKFSNETSQVIVLSTVLSLITVSLWVSLLTG